MLGFLKGCYCAQCLLYCIDDISLMRVSVKELISLAANFSDKFIVGAVLILKIGMHFFS